MKWNKKINKFQHQMRCPSYLKVKRQIYIYLPSQNSLLRKRMQLKVKYFGIDTDLLTKCIYYWISQTARSYFVKSCVVKTMCCRETYANIRQNATSGSVRERCIFVFYGLLLVTSYARKTLCVVEKTAYNTGIESAVARVTLVKVHVHSSE